MKKYIITFILLILSISTYAADGSGVITLCHQGKTTLFNYDEMQTAVNSAEEGDTIMLSDGVFTESFHFTKELCFIGTDMDKTDITGDVYVDIPESTKLKKTLFEKIHFSGLEFKYKLENITLKECATNTGPKFFPEGAKNVLLDHCDWTLTATYNTIDGITIKNSYITLSAGYQYKWKNVKFINCNIWTNIGGITPILAGEFTNCIIYGIEYGYNYPDVKLTNVLYSKRASSDFNNETDLNLCNKNNCWYEEDSQSHILFYTKEELSQKGYLGTDDTVIGMYGGDEMNNIKSNMPVITLNKTHRNTTNKTIEFNFSITSK